MPRPQPRGQVTYRPDGGTGAPAGSTIDPPEEGGQDPQKSPGVTTEDPPKLTPEQAQAEAAKARKEAAQYRSEKKKLEERLAELEGEKLSDSEKLQKERDGLVGENTALTDRVKSLEVRLAVAELSTALGIVDAEAAVAMLDTSAVKFDGGGQPVRKEIERELIDLVKRKPYLVRHGDAGGGGGAGVETDTDVNGMIRKAAGRA